MKPPVPLFDLRAGANLKHFCNVVVRCRAKLGTHLPTYEGAQRLVNVDQSASRALCTRTLFTLVIASLKQSETHYDNFHPNDDE